MSAGSPFVHFMARAGAEAFSQLKASEEARAAGGESPAVAESRKNQERSFTLGRRPVGPEVQLASTCARVERLDSRSTA